jgi:hypothetical protein
VLPAADSGSVVLREGADALHPLGRLRLTQTVAPLGVPLARFGSAAVLDAGPVKVDVVAAMATPVPAEELFAAAQFFDLSDEEKISKPAFVPHQAGVVLEGSAWSVTGPLTREVVYEESNGEERPKAGSRVLGALREEYLDWCVIGAAGRARGEQVAVTGLEQVKVNPVAYAVADAATGIAATTSSGLDAAFATSGRHSVDHVVVADYELAAFA